MAISEQQISAILDKSVSAFNSGKTEFFDAFAKDVVVFMPDNREPVKGLDAFKQAFHTMLTSEGEEKVLDRNIQILDDKAVVTQTVQVMLPTQTLHVRQTMIVGLTAGTVQVQHLQSSLISPAKNLPAVSVVNQRIATVAPVLGVAQ